MNWKKTLKLTLNCLIAGLAFYYVFSQVSFTEVWNSIRSVNLPLLVLSLLFGLTALPIRAYRWAYILRPRVIPGADLISPVFVGAVANLLPARLGELYRAYLLTEKNDVPYMTSLGSIFVERLFDVLFLLLLTSGMLLLGDTIPDTTVDVAFLQTEINLKSVFMRFSQATLLTAVFLVLITVILVKFPVYIRNFLKRVLPVTDWSGKLLHYFDELVAGLSVLKNPRSCIGITVYSTCVWLMFFLNEAVCAWSFGLTDFWIAGYMCLVYAGIFITLFPTPAFLGSFQLGCFVALHSILGVDEEIATGYGLVLWVVQFVPIFIIGIFFITRDHLELNRFPGLAETDGHRETEKDELQ